MADQIEDVTLLNLSQLFTRAHAVGLIDDARLLRLRQSLFFVLHPNSGDAHLQARTAALDEDEITAQTAGYMEAVLRACLWGMQTTDGNPNKELAALLNAWRKSKELNR